MPKSSLAIHKESLIFAQGRFNSLVGGYTMGNFGKPGEAVGSFAVFDAIYILSGTASGFKEILGPIPVQTCHVGGDGKLHASNEWRCADYRMRIAVDIENDRVELHELRDMDDDPAREDWYVRYVL